MKRPSYVLTIFFISLLSACASRPVIDPKGVDMQAYKNDLKECEEVTKQLESGENIAKSAAFGALVLGALGAVIDPENAVKNATVGAIEGGTVGALKTDDEEGRVLKKCLKNRGYKILN